MVAVNKGLKMLIITPEASETTLFVPFKNEPFSYWSFNLTGTLEPDSGFTWKFNLISKLQANGE